MLIIGCTQTVYRRGDVRGSEALAADVRELPLERVVIHIGLRAVAGVVEIDWDVIGDALRAAELCDPDNHALAESFVDAARARSGPYPVPLVVDRDPVVLVWLARTVDSPAQRLALERSGAVVSCRAPGLTLFVTLVPGGGRRAWVGDDQQRAVLERAAVLLESLRLGDATG